MGLLTDALLQLLVEPEDRPAARELLDKLTKRKPENTEPVIDAEGESEDQNGDRTTEV